VSAKKRTVPWAVRFSRPPGGVETVRGAGGFRWTPGVLTGVPAGAWYEESVRLLYELGLTEGGAFAPNGRLTLAEVISLAVRLHRTYNGWTAADLSDLQYALNTGIIAKDQYDNYSDPATRRSFAAIMANALPGEGPRGMNVVMDGVIPDVPMTDPGANGIYTLYRAGVLLGEDVKGTFSPDSLITRAAAAVAAAWIVDPSLRQGISLLSADSYGVALNRTSLKLLPGASMTLTASVSPTNATDRSVTWASSKPRIAVVDQDGTVTAVGPGKALIIATSAAGATATCTVRVMEPIQQGLVRLHGRADSALQSKANRGRLPPLASSGRGSRAAPCVCHVSRRFPWAGSLFQPQKFRGGRNLFPSLFVYIGKGREKEAAL